jgi:hypothetical protein
MVGDPGRSTIIFDFNGLVAGFLRCDINRDGANRCI